MLLRFYTYEEACLFTAMKRADGFFAEVIHQNAGHIWGNMVVDGFAVIVSEEAAPEGVVVPVPEVPSISEEAKMVAMLGLLGMLGTVGYMLFVLAMLGMGFFAAPLEWQMQFLIFNVSLLFILWVMLKMTRIYNRPSHPFYGLSRFMMKLIMWLIIIF